MEQMTEGQKLTCKKGTIHDDEPILMICLNEECQAKRLCCLVCIDQLHRKHELVSLSKFENIIKDSLYFNTENTNKEAILSRLREYQKSLHQRVNKLQEESLKQFAQMTHKISNYFNQIYQTFTISPWVNIRQKHFGNKLTNQTACHFYKQSKDTANQIFQSEKVLNAAIASTDTIINKYYDEGFKIIKNAIQSISLNLQKIRLGSTSPTKLFLNRFSQVYKSVALQYNNQRNTVTRIVNDSLSGGYPIALSQYPLKATNNKISFKIEQQPGNYGIWMGICALDIVKGFNFVNCYGMGKGAYAIDQFNVSSNTAYSWNSHDTNFNSKPIVGWNFIPGDVITITINFDNSTVTFEKGTSSYTQPIKLDIGDLYAFAGPTNLGDKISIVS